MKKGIISISTVLLLILLININTIFLNFSIENELNFNQTIRINKIAEIARDIERGLNEIIKEERNISVSEENGFTYFNQVIPINSIIQEKFNADLLKNDLNTFIYFVKEKTTSTKINIDFNEMNNVIFNIKPLKIKFIEVMNQFDQNKKGFKITAEEINFKGIELNLSEYNIIDINWLNGPNTSSNGIYLNLIDNDDNVMYNDLNFYNNHLKIGISNDSVIDLLFDLNGFQLNQESNKELKITTGIDLSDYNQSIDIILEGIDFNIIKGTNKIKVK